MPDTTGPRSTRKMTVHGEKDTLSRFTLTLPSYKVLWEPSQGGSPCPQVPQRGREQPSPGLFPIGLSEPEPSCQHQPLWPLFHGPASYHQKAGAASAPPGIPLNGALRHSSHPAVPLGYSHPSPCWEEAWASWRCLPDCLEVPPAQETVPKARLVRPPTVSFWVTWAGLATAWQTLSRLLTHACRGRLLQRDLL